MSFEVGWLLTFKTCLYHVSLSILPFQGCSKYARRFLQRSRHPRCVSSQIQDDNLVVSMYMRKALVIMVLKYHVPSYAYLSSSFIFPRINGCNESCQMPKSQLVLQSGFRGRDSACTMETPYEEKRTGSVIHPSGSLSAFMRQLQPDPPPFKQIIASTRRPSQDGSALSPQSLTYKGHQFSFDTRA